MPTARDRQWPLRGHISRSVRRHVEDVSATIGAGTERTGDLSMATLKTTGMALATAAALLFGSVAVTAAHAEDAKVKCEGANSCKGKSACAGAKNSCQGQNSCKGTGYVMLTKEDCAAAKKKIEAEKKPS